MTIVSLAFDFGLKGVAQWHKAVDYILEKGKGLMLGKLRTIKLLECDLNFGLKWAFAWRLGSFAENHKLYTKSQHVLPGLCCHSPVTLLNKSWPLTYYNIPIWMKRSETMTPSPPLTNSSLH